MNITIYDDRKYVLLTDWDQEDWDSQKGQIPWDYTLQIEPMLPDYKIEELATGRQVVYETITVYDQRFENNTWIVTPREYTTQKLLPLASDPTQTSSNPGGAT